MGVIKDIRIFRSNNKTTDETNQLWYFNNKKLYAIVHRIVMKLRKNAFSLGNFDHLYINLTTNLNEGMVSQRSVYTYHKWYRCYDVGISEMLYSSLETEESIKDVIEILQEILLTLYDSESLLIKSSVNEAVHCGERMLMLFKSKQSAKRTAHIYLRYSDNGYYLPLLCVYDETGNELLRKNLPETVDLYIIGEIRLSNKKVTVNPRKNSFTKDLSPISFDL